MDWCNGNDQTFVSGSHDTVLKMWDIRAFKTPLFDLKGHSEQVLCCSWSEPSIIVSGGADNDMKIFKSGKKKKIYEHKNYNYVLPLKILNTR